MGASNLAIVFGPTMVWSLFSPFGMCFCCLTDPQSQKKKQKQILDVAPRQCPPWGPCNSASTTGFKFLLAPCRDYRFSEPNRGVPDRPPIFFVVFLTKLPTFLFFEHSKKIECISVRKIFFLWINANDKNLLRWLAQLVRTKLFISLSKINSLTRTIISITLLAKWWQRI